MDLFKGSQAQRFSSPEGFKPSTPYFEAEGRGKGGCAQKPACPRCGRPVYFIGQQRKGNRVYYIAHHYLGYEKVEGLHSLGLAGMIDPFRERSSSRSCRRPTSRQQTCWNRRAWQLSPPIFPALEGA
jgi:hypothetical protein